MPYFLDRIGGVGYGPSLPPNATQLSVIEYMNLRQFHAADRHAALPCLRAVGPYQLAYDAYDEALRAHRKVSEECSEATQALTRCNSELQLFRGQRLHASMKPDSTKERDEGYRKTIEDLEKKYEVLSAELLEINARLLERQQATAEAERVLVAAWLQVSPMPDNKGGYQPYAEAGPHPALWAKWGGREPS